jgi:hypothetical protein
VGVFPKVLAVLDYAQINCIRDIFPKNKFQTRFDGQYESRRFNPGFEFAGLRAMPLGCAAHTSALALARAWHLQTVWLMSMASLGAESR